MDVIQILLLWYLTRSFPFTFEPRRLTFCPVSFHEISNMRIYLTDSKGRPVDLNDIDRSMVLILRSTGKRNYIA